MKRILIFSDSHGNVNRCEDIINNFDQKIDMIIHAGDYTRDAEDIESVYDNIDVRYVRGNCDIFSNASSDIVFEVEGATVFVTHGHDYRVKYESNYGTLVRRAQQLGADLCVFGHTHIPHTDYIGKLTLLNPGSIGFGGTYAVAEIDNGSVKTKILEYSL